MPQLNRQQPRRSCSKAAAPRLSAGDPDMEDDYGLMEQSAETDFTLLEQQLVEVAGEFAEANPGLGMILLECTTFPTFAAAIQQRVCLPVVDYIGFIDFIFKSVVCKNYEGFV